jgi:hypothetical protein
MANQLTTAIKETLEEWDTQQARAINEGECMEFVNRILLEYDQLDIERKTTDDLPDHLIQKGEDTYKPEPYHEWLTDGSKHYDAETPHGVKSWRDLPFFKRTLGT